MNINDSEKQFKRPPIKLPENRNFFVLVGANNSGKSTFLRAVFKNLRPDSYLIDVHRTKISGEGAPDKNYKKNYENFLNQLTTRNTDNAEKVIQVLQDFFNLKDCQREPIREWYNKYFPNRLYEEREDAENTASPMYLKINDFPITSQGTGIRCTLEIFVKLFDPKVKILCIDEPEMGLEPTLQKFLYRALKNRTSKDKKIIIATHSHHFLDYNSVTNNYVCARDSAGKIYLDRVRNIQDFQDIVFRLLGNNLEGLFMPEKLLIAEGPSDNIFLSKCLKVLDKKGLKVHACGGDSKIAPTAEAITQFLRLNATSNSPYLDRTWILADKQIGDTRRREWIKLLGSSSHVCILKQNGIEHYYPERILQRIFSVSLPRHKIIESFLKSGEIHGIKKTKVELAREVAMQITKKVITDEISNNELFNYLNGL